MIKSVAYFTGRNINNGRQPLQVMIWWGLSAIWTRYVFVFRFFTPHSSHRRLSITSTLPVPLSGSVCVNSDMYAALGQYCHLRTHCRLKIWQSVVSLSPRVVLVMCTKGHSTVRGFASNALGSTPRMALRKPQRYIFDAITSLPTVPDEIRRPSTRRLLCGNVWSIEILSPSSVSLQIRSSLSHNGCPAET